MAYFDLSGCPDYFSIGVFFLSFLVTRQRVDLITGSDFAGVEHREGKAVF